MRLPLLIAPLLGLAVTAVQAQTQAAGLWEHTMTMKSSSGEMEAAQAQLERQLASMPPDKRKQIEDMMASRGVKLSAQGTTLKVCIGKEQAARPAQPPMSGDCRQSDVQRTANSMRYKFACTTPQKVEGEGEVTWSGDKSYSGTSSVTSQVNGKPQQMRMAMAGRWLGADCGDVKPLAVPSSQ